MPRTVTLWFVVLGLAWGLSCAGRDRTVRLQFRFQPDTRAVYRTIVKGNVQVYENERLVTDRREQVGVSTVRIVRRLRTDSLADVEEIQTYRCRLFDRLDSSVVDTFVQGERLRLVIAPSGRVMEYEILGEPAVGTAEELQAFYEQAAVEFPAGDLRVGESWTQRVRLEVDGRTVNAATTFTVLSFTRERGRDCVTISYTGDVALPLRSMPEDSVQRQGRQRLTVRGVLYFAYRDGLLLSQREHRTITGEGRRWLRGRLDEVVPFRFTAEYDITVNLKTPPAPIS